MGYVPVSLYLTTSVATESLPYVHRLRLSASPYSGAKREHKTVMEIAKFYTDAFFADCEKLNIKRPDVVEPATHCIADFIKVISSLIKKGYAYEAGGNIYFDTSKLEKYYVFNDFKEEDLAVGVREGVEEDGNKRNKADFVLWFTKSKFDDQELKWDSPCYIVFTDRTLIDMCSKLPQNEDEMLNVSGVGQNKLKKYGQRFLQEISAFQSANH